MPPVDLLHWGLAAIPLVLLLVTLVVFRWQAHEAAAVGMFSAILVAFGAYRAGVTDVAVASAVGIWESVFILYIIIPALVFYHVIDRADGFDALREEISTFTDNELFLVLGFGWVFVSFMQSISGFGTPIVVVAPLLLALGVKPVYAVAIPLVGHAWANTFGTLGVAWVTLEGLVEMQSVLATALAAGVLLWMVNVVAGVTIAYMYGRTQAVLYALPMIAVVSLVHGGGQLVGIQFWEPAFANFLAASLALLVLAPLALLKPYASESGSVDVTPAMAERIAPAGTPGERSAVTDGGIVDAEAVAADENDQGLMSLPLAALPFIVLAVVAFVTAAVEPLGDLLATAEFVVPFPAVETGYGVETAAVGAGDGLAPLSHPGSFLLLSALVAYVAYRVTGHYEAAAARREEPALGLGRVVLATAIPATVAVMGFLVMALVMDYTGQTAVLARGIAEVSTPATYGLLSPLIGALGSFMTSSNTASNILFGGLQQETAGALGTDESWILAGQTAGGAIGNAISPANVILGTTAVGIVGKEGDVLRRTIPWVAAVATAIGVAIVVFTTVGFLGVA
ncbi:L-lactate permease [Halorubrum gandharaense]